MRYNPPFGSVDPNAPFLDRNTPAAIAGSRVPAAAVEYPQREIMAVIDAAGISGDNADLTQLLQAIQSLIDAATGGAGDPNYVLMTQARVRLPIYPEVQTSDGTLPVISPGAGQVRVPVGYNFLHRGIFNVTTTQVDFATSVSKTYHLRWNPTSGFVLKDLSDVAYNPAALAEGHSNFDTTYDDMLVSRIVTNASNVATIVNLVNRDRMSYFLATGRVTTGVNIGDTPYGTASVYKAGNRFTYNFARSPSMQSIIAIVGATFGSSIGIEGAANAVFNKVIDRYSTVFDVATDYKPDASGVYVEIEFRASA